MLAQSSDALRDTPKESIKLQNSCIGHVQLFLLRWKQHRPSVPSHNQRNHTMSSGPLEILETIFHFSVLHWSSYWVTQKLLVLSGEQKNKRLYNRIRLSCKLLCHLGQRTQQVSGVWCVSGRWRCWSLWQASHVNCGVSPLALGAESSHPFQVATLLWRNSSLPVSGSY